MEQIVSGIAGINFQQNLNIQETSTQNALTTEKENRNIWHTYIANMASEMSPAAHMDSANASKVVGKEDVTDSEDSGAEIAAGDKMKTFLQRRCMPRRASKDNSLQKIKRRTITKPTKQVNHTLEMSRLRPADIKRIYTNQKLTKFRPSNLETIFEEPTSTAALQVNDNCDIEDVGLNIDVTQVRFVGAKKMKRSISCCDGLNINKTLIKKRRAKIQKTFGRRFALKKIPLNEFFERLNKNIGESKIEEGSAIDASALQDNVSTNLEDKPCTAQNCLMDVETADINV